jgi:hypothetical protein
VSTIPASPGARATPTFAYLVRIERPVVSFARIVAFESTGVFDLSPGEIQILPLLLDAGLGELHLFLLFA